MKRKNKLISGISIFAMLVGVGVVVSNNDTSVVKAAETSVLGTYSTMTTSEDGKTRVWDFTTHSNTTEKVDVKGVIDNELWFVSTGDKTDKIRHYSDGYLSHKVGAELYIPVPSESAGTISFIDKNEKTDRYTELKVNGVGTTRYVYCTKSATPFEFTAADITVVNEVSYLHFVNVVNEMKSTSITVNLTVNSYNGADVYATGIVDNEVESPINIASGESHALNYTITTESGEPTTDKSVWASANEEVATVVDGVVTAVGAGDTSVTLTVGSVSHSWDIHVDPVVATAITLDLESLSGLVGGTAQLTATLTPANATSEITWASSNEEVATVVDGVVSYVGVGEANITATVEGTLVANCAVSVSYISTTEITLDQQTLSLGVNGSVTLVATVAPVDSQDAITWASSNEEVATVVDGVVTGVKEGNATITATSGSFSAECVVTVAYKPAESITLSATSLSMFVNETKKIDVTVAPEDANDIPSFESADETVALVDNNGNVRASGIGSTTITVTCGSVTETVTVEVLSGGDLTFRSNVDAYPAEATENYYVNGYSMYFNKTASKEQTIDGVTYSTAIQVKSITFFAPTRGIITANFCQTGNDKNRDLQLLNANGEVVYSEHLPSNQDVHKFVADVKTAGFYTLYVLDNASADGTEGMINLYTLKYDEIHVFAGYQERTNADSSKSVRIVGGIDETIDLANVKTFGAEVNGTKYATNVALTNLLVGDRVALPSDYGFSYFFTYIVENATSFTFRTYVELTNGTVLYSSAYANNLTF